MMTRWNTGRQYTHVGQPMEALLVEETGRILFADLARGIQGCIEAADWADLIQTEEQLQRAVMRAYDDGQYTPA
jgi:hypothetical protein